MMNAIGVLSRADEIGAGRLDALVSARRVARRYAPIPWSGSCARPSSRWPGCWRRRVARCGRPNTWPCEASRTTIPRPQTEDLLLSVDRFVRSDAADDRARPRRQGAAARPPRGLRRPPLDHHDQGGIAGRDRAGRRPGQAQRARTSSAGCWSMQFTERRDLLKARSALLALDRMLREHPLPQHTGAVRGGRADPRRRARVPGAAAAARTAPARPRPAPDAANEAERLLGGSGTSAYRRCGLTDDASALEVRSAARDAIARWRVRAESPLSDRAVADASRVVIRSCEGILAQFS